MRTRSLNNSRECERPSHRGIRSFGLDDVILAEPWRSATNVGCWVILRWLLLMWRSGDVWIYGLKDDD
eukprot:9136154-Prorocentrum_lima.AAC.1